MPRLGPIGTRYLQGGGEVGGRRRINKGRSRGSEPPKCKIPVDGFESNQKASLATPNMWLFQCQWYRGKKIMSKEHDKIRACPQELRAATDFKSPKMLSMGSSLYMLLMIQNYPVETVVAGKNVPPKIQKQVFLSFPLFFLTSSSLRRREKKRRKKKPPNAHRLDRKKQSLAKLH